MLKKEGIERSSNDLLPFFVDGVNTNGNVTGYRVGNDKSILHHRTRMYSPYIRVDVLQGNTTERMWKMTENARAKKVNTKASFREDIRKR